MKISGCARWTSAGNCWSAKRESSKCRWPDRRSGPGPHRKRIRSGHRGRLLATLGQGKNTAHQLLSKLRGLRRSARSRAGLGAQVGRSGHVRRGAPAAPYRLGFAPGGGQNDLLVYRARCCNPIRGEEIVGYVTRGKAWPSMPAVVRMCRICSTRATGASASSGRARPGKRGQAQRYPVKIIVHCEDRTGMLKGVDRRHL